MPNLDAPGASFNDGDFLRRVGNALQGISPAEVADLLADLPSEDLESLATALGVSGGGGGVDGNRIRSGAGAPSGGLGNNDDYYINLTNGDFYGPKTGGSWGSPISLRGPAGANGSNGATGATGATGAAGAAGNSLRSGAGVPDPSLGADGDFYINTSADTIYGPKTAGAWGSPTSIIGPSGEGGGGLTGDYVPLDDFPVTMYFGLSAETSAAVEDSLVRRRMPFEFTLLEVRGVAGTADTGEDTIIDIIDGVTSLSILDDLITIPVNTKTSIGATVEPTIATPGIADDLELIFKLEQVGTVTRAVGVWLRGYRVLDGASASTVPGIPLSLSATGANTQVTLSWSAPANNGGESLTDYLVQYRVNGDPTWITFSDGTSATTGAVVTGLTNGTTYNFRVAAVNVLGAGAYGSSVNGTPATVPSAVGTVTPTPGDEEVALAWSAPANGGSAITDYIVQYKETSSGTWLTFTDGATSSTGATVTGLTNDTDYDFRVAAINVIGTGTYSATATSTPTAPSGSPPGWYGVSDASTTNSGHVSSNNATYSTARSNTTGGAVDVTGDFTIGQRWTGSQYVIWEGFFDWDFGPTGLLPDSNITNVELVILVGGANNTDTNDTLNIYVVDYGTLTTADFVGSGEYGSLPTVAATYDTANVGTSGICTPNGTELIDQVKAVIDGGATHVRLLFIPSRVIAGTAPTGNEYFTTGAVGSELAITVS
jgi:hypothetical protein